MEHDPEEVFTNTPSGLTEIRTKNKLTASDIAVVSITNQREISLIWDKITGKPTTNAAV